MKVFGRKLLDRGEQQHIDFDDLVFEVADGVEISVSVYRARNDGRVEIRTNEGVLVLLPRAANSAEAEVRYRDAVSTPGESS
jgi:hypothetical protein